MTAQAFSPAEERGTLVGGSLSTAAIASLAACEENRPWRVGQRVLGCGACTLSCVGGMYGWSTGRILGFTRDGDGGPTLWLCSDDHRADVAQRGRKGQIGRMESVGMWSTVWYTGAPVPVPRRRCRSRDQSFRYAGRRFVSHFFYRVSFGSHGCALMVCWLLRCTPCAVGRGRGRVFGRYIAKTAVYGFSVSRLACIDYCEMCIRSFY